MLKTLSTITKKTLGIEGLLKEICHKYTETNNKEYKKEV